MGAEGGHSCPALGFAGCSSNLYQSKSCLLSDRLSEFKQIKISFINLLSCLFALPMIVRFQTNLQSAFHYLLPNSRTFIKTNSYLKGV
jgi:hypothetical protein